MKSKPWLIIIFISLVTFLLWFTAKANFFPISQPLRYLSQLFALLGIIFIALNLLLSCRLKFIDKLFGGLGSAYKFHHSLGSLAFILIIFHPLLQIFPFLSSATTYLLPGTNLSYNMGIYGLYLMITGFLFIVVIKLPYHLWKLTHKLIGLAFFPISAHFLLIQSDISAFLPLRIWVGLFVILGIISATYILFLYKSFGPRFSYQISRIIKHHNIFDVYLTPVTSKLINYHPGQFAYLRFNTPSISSETHPFTFSSSPLDPFIRFSIKKLGDFTTTLDQMKKGQLVDVYGPYGHFGQNISPNSHQVWIAGGIGITPFLSFLHHYSFIHSPVSIDFFYTYKNPQEGIYLKEIESLITKLPNIHFIKWPSVKNGHLTAQIIISQISSPIDNILICGSTGLRQNFTRQLINAGHSPQKIVFEDFSFI